MKYNIKVIYSDNSWSQSDPSRGLKWKWFKKSMVKAAQFYMDKRKEGCIGLEFYVKLTKGWTKIPKQSVESYLK